LIVTLLRDPGTSARGGTPTNPVPHDEPVTVHELAGTSQLGPLHAVQDTTHPPVPLVTAVTEAGAPGPTAVVVNLTGAEDVERFPI
jgi:hypothetical protein